MLFLLGTASSSSPPAGFSTPPTAPALLIVGPAASSSSPVLLPAPRPAASSSCADPWRRASSAPPTPGATSAQPRPPAAAGRGVAPPPPRRAPRRLLHTASSSRRGGLSSRATAAVLLHTPPDPRHHRAAATTAGRHTPPDSRPRRPLHPSPSSPLLRIHRRPSLLPAGRREERGRLPRGGERGDRVGTGSTPHLASEASDWTVRKSLRFSTLSSNEIRKSAEVQVWNNRIYGTDMKPVPNGLLDMRMGLTKKGKKKLDEEEQRCTTCHGPFAECPGHFGYLKLALPVFNVGFFNCVLDVLKCICKSCSRVLLAEKERREFMQKMRNPKADALQKSATMKKVRDKCKLSCCPRCEYRNGDEPVVFADNQVWETPEQVFAEEDLEGSCGDPNQEFQDYDEF